MEIIYKRYLPSEEIPVYDHVSRRKLVKYYTRDTMAAVVCMGLLYKDQKPASDTPFYFSTSETQMLDYYKDACKVFDQNNIPFSSFHFIEKAVPAISPLSHFKTMRNMAHCFISIEYGLKGDNAALLGPASGLLACAMLSDYNGAVIIGAAKLHADGTAEAGIAKITPREAALEPMLGSNQEAIMFFRKHGLNQQEICL